MATPTNLPSSFTSGDVLTAANMNNLRGAFRILQVVSAVADTQVASTSTTWVDTTLTATITPQSSASKIFVLYSQSIYTNASQTAASLRLVRNGSVIRTYADLSYGTGAGILVHHGLYEFDSPASTSALTYKTQFMRGLGTGIAYVQVNQTQNISTMTLFEVSA